MPHNGSLDRTDYRSNFVSTPSIFRIVATLGVILARSTRFRV
jgi:hypothetical protein